MFPILEAGPSLEGASLPAFVVARDGLYLRKRSLLGLSQTKVGRIAHLPEGKEFVDYALPKVPADLMARAVGFFRAVYRLQRTEALCLLVWRDGVFDLVVPAQKVSSVSVTFDLAAGDVPAGSRLVGSMHSHGAFGAYASSIDEDDEAELDGLHIVVGDFDRRRLGYSAAVVVDGIRFQLQIGQLIERAMKCLQPLGREPSQRSPESRNLSQRCGQSEHVPGVRCLQSYPAQQAFEIQDSVQRPTQLLARHCLVHLRFNCVQPCIDLSYFDRRSQHPRTQQSLAHGRDRGVNRSKQSHSGVGAGKQRLDEFQISHRYRIKHQIVLSFVKPDSVYVV
jgi:proteasome lid subunit RPN8/RPN11